MTREAEIAKGVPSQAEKCEEPPKNGRGEGGFSCRNFDGTRESSWP